MTKRLTKSALAVLATGTCLGMASAAHAQSPEFSSCATLAAAACIEQVGNGNNTSIDQRNSTSSLAATLVSGNGNTVAIIQAGSNNRALAAIRGSRNGAGGQMSFRDNAGYTGPNAATRTIAFPGNAASGGAPNITQADLPSGKIIQSGSNNAAAVAIFGNENQFHVTQNGNGNAAVQAIAGAYNQAATLQNAGNQNTAVQLQLGAFNSALVQQAGSNNVAVEVQAGPASVAVPATIGALATLAGNNTVATWAESVLANVNGSSGPGANNEVALQQNGGNNSALLGQFGDQNKLALTQDGGQVAAITQWGTGHQLALTQGTPIIFITQY